MQTLLTREAIVAELHDAIREMDLDLPADLPEDARFKDDLGLDSLDLAEFVARIEQRFRLPIADDDWQELQTIGLAADYVLEQLR